MRHANSAVIEMWKAITMGVATIAAAVAGAGLSGRTASHASAARPRPIAAMPPAGFARAGPGWTGNRLPNATP